MPEPKTTVADRLRAVMKKFQVNGNPTMAKLCGSTGSAVNNWLCGYNMPRVPEMTRLCEQTGITLDWLYRGHAGLMDTKLASRLTKRIGAAQGALCTRGRRA